MKMSHVGFNSTIRARGKEYLLQTSNDAFKNRIVSSLFESGQIIDSNEVSYDPAISEEDLLNLVRFAHEERRTETESLLKLSEKLAGAGQVDYLNWLGLAFLKRRMFNEAIAEFEGAVKSDPTTSQTYNNLGRAYLAVERYDDAIATFKKSISLDPDYADYRHNLGIAYFKKELCLKAAEEFKKAIALNVYYVEAYYDLGLTYILNAIAKEDFSLASNLYERTMESLEKAVRIKPSLRNDHYELGRQHLEAGELPDALREFSLAREDLKTTVEDLPSLDFYLKFLYDQERMDEDVIKRYINQLDKFLIKNPNYADVYNDLGVAYTILCKYINDRAISCFEKALEINPAYKKAERNLKLSMNDSRGFHLLLQALMR